MANRLAPAIPFISAIALGVVVALLLPESQPTIERAIATVIVGTIFVLIVLPLVLLNLSRKGTSKRSARTSVRPVRTTVTESSGASQNGEPHSAPSSDSDKTPPDLDLAVFPFLGERAPRRIDRSSSGWFTRLLARDPASERLPLPTQVVRVRGHEEQIRVTEMKPGYLLVEFETDDLARSESLADLSNLV